MGKKAYIGVGGIARDIKQIYIGVNGVARKVKKAYIGVNGVARLAYQAGTPIGTLPVGSIVKIKENGVWVDYLIVHQGLPGSMYDASCNGTWVLRKDIVERMQWHSANVNDYANSAIHAYLNSTVLGRFDAAIQGAIKQVKIPYRPGSGTGKGISSGGSGLPCKVFLLSVGEVGCTESDVQYFIVDGTKLSYFLAGNNTEANAKRIAADYWWLRSPSSYMSTMVCFVNNGGMCYFSDCVNTVTAGHYIRPAFILPSSLTVADGGYVTG